MCLTINFVAIIFKIKGRIPKSLKKSRKNKIIDDHAKIK